MRRPPPILALIPLVALGCGETRGARPSGPNVVVVSIDSLRADHLGCYGYARPTSPTIDRLAAEGARFETCVSTTSWTLPAHAALFTGLYDTTHGLVDNGLRLADEHWTLAEMLRGAGWETAGFFGGPYLHPTFGLGQGFDHYQSCMTGVEDAADEDRIRTEAMVASATLSAEGRTGPRTLAEIERWAETAGDGPHFLFVHLWDVHYDYAPPAEYVEMFDPDYTGTLTGEGFETNPAIHPDMDPRDLEHLVALYDGEIRFTDDVLGRILGVLEARGMLDDAVVLITADHGEEFFEHGDKGHQRTLYEEVVRVPLVVWAPGRVRARDVPDQVQLVDVFPTVLALCGIDDRPDVQGRDLSPLLAGEDMEPGEALLELHVDGQSTMGWRGRDLKVLRRRGSRVQAFDLRADPGERSVLGIDDDARVADGRDRLRELVKAASERRDALDIAPQPFEMSESMRARLAELGYLDASTDDDAAAPIEASSKR